MLSIDGTSIIIWRLAMRKKILLSILSMVLVTSVFSACGNTESESESSAVAGTSSTLSKSTNDVGFKDVLKAENFEFKIISADEAKSFKNALGNEYKAKDGMKLLLVVISAKNTSDDTMNVENVNFNSYVDDDKISIESATGEINGYKPLLGAVSRKKSMVGYTIWQVPDNWKKLEFSYIDSLSGSESDKMVIKSTDIK